MDDIDIKLIGIIKNVSRSQFNDEEIMKSTDFILDLDFDSIMSIQLVVACENEFNIKIDDDLMFDVIGDYKKLKETITGNLYQAVNRD